MSIGRLCFGTSTFVAGRLFPEKDSAPGVRALSQALSDGLRWVHSNPALGTQWAIRSAWKRAGRPAIRHLVKVECPLGINDSVHDTVSGSIQLSLQNLGVENLNAAVIEIDLKGTPDLRVLADKERVRDFYAEAASEVLATGAVGGAFGYCHSPQHMASALSIDSFTGLAAQFSPLEHWPRGFFAEIAARKLQFLGMAPLARGRLAAASIRAGIASTRPLAWSLSHVEVTQAVLTMSSVAHWNQTLATVRGQYDTVRERSDFEAWGIDCPPDLPLAILPVRLSTGDGS